MKKTVYYVTSTDNDGEIPQFYAGPFSEAGQAAEWILDQSAGDIFDLLSIFKIVPTPEKTLDI